MADDALLLKRVRSLCTDYDGCRGIWKRIDENRQLLEFLQENASEFLKENKHIEIWLGNQDIFLVNLMRILELPEYPESAAISKQFPRKWPGTDAIYSAYMNFPPHMAEIMGKPEGKISA